MAVTAEMPLGFAFRMVNWLCRVANEVAWGLGQLNPVTCGAWFRLSPAQAKSGFLDTQMGFIIAVSVSGQLCETPRL